MSPDFYSKWAHILADVDKNAIPIEFIRKLIIRMEGRKQHTINIERMLKQGLLPETIEDHVSRKLVELDDMVESIEFVLNLETIATRVQPEIDRLLNGLK